MMDLARLVDEVLRIMMENPSLDAELNPMTNAELNPSTNPKLNPATNPELNPFTNPKLNPHTNPEFIKEEYRLLKKYLGKYLEK